MHEKNWQNRQTLKLVRFMARLRIPPFTTFGFSYHLPTTFPLLTQPWAPRTTFLVLLKMRNHLQPELYSIAETIESTEDDTQFCHFVGNVFALLNRSGKMWQLILDVL